MGNGECWRRPTCQVVPSWQERLKAVQPSPGSVWRGGALGGGGMEPHGKSSSGWPEAARPLRTSWTGCGVMSQVSWAWPGTGPTGRAPFQRPHPRQKRPGLLLGRQQEDAHLPPTRCWPGSGLGWGAWVSVSVLQRGFVFCPWGCVVRQGVGV